LVSLALLGHRSVGLELVHDPVQVVRLLDAHPLRHLADRDAGVIANDLQGLVGAGASTASATAAAVGAAAAGGRAAWTAGAALGGAATGSPRTAPATGGDSLQRFLHLLEVRVLLDLRTQFVQTLLERPELLGEKVSHLHTSFHERVSE